MSFLMALAAFNDALCNSSTSSKISIRLLAVASPLAVILQHDRVSSFSALVVAPLTSASPALAGTRLHPSLDVSGRRFVVLVEELAAVARRTLGNTNRQNE